MFSNTRRTVLRLAVTGAVAAAPVAGLAVSAHAEEPPATTEVARPNHNNPWDHSGLWDWNRDNRWDDECDPSDRRHHHPGLGWHRVVPPGWFGSS
ncbi:hypothetical protein ACFYTQ_00400 [Nocardia sp. NPDC004068]|uniref:hypothetical protein n=1 Tax=Nocardia sp. NPDC004068 TaxID=3364303 RepID=UPI00368BC0E0